VPVVPSADDGPGSFDTLRSWDGSQHRAFEELSYQLLKDAVPPGATAVRTGNPDGGVEWYATLDDGSEWGWQAKHVRDFDQLLGAMRASVQRVVTDRPRTHRLTFVISTNLDEGTQGQRRRSQRDRYRDAVERWKRDVHGAARIEFDLVQESDLLDLLARPEHLGRRWFWWNQPAFSPAWLEDRFKEQWSAASERYRPELQVDLPIQADIEALGYDDAIATEVGEPISRLAKEASRLHTKPIGRSKRANAVRKASGAAASLRALTANWVVAPDRPAGDFDHLLAALGDLLGAVSRVEDIEEAERESRRKVPGEAKAISKGVDARRLDVPPGYDFWRLRDAARELVDWLESPKGEAFRGCPYFLAGVAGSGKTHLFLDAVRRGLDRRRPVVFLAASRFGRGDLWASVTDQLGLPQLGADSLLGAMSAAAESASLRGNRFVLLVDALNETPDSSFWRDQLPALRAAVARYPFVSLAVSCRDTYLQVVDDGTERTHYVAREHPGFAGRELEATQKYFDHYGLEAPRIPLLVPEFTVPLFLRMYCEGLADIGATAGVGHEGRVRIFERFLDAKIRRVGQRQVGPNATNYEIDAARQRVRAVLDAMLDELAQTGREALTRARGEEIAAAASQGGPAETARVLGALEAEGVLSLEPVYIEGGVQQGFRILFQAFADYLILQRRLAEVTDPTSDADFPRWLSVQASFGVLEAAAVVLPERFCVELPDLLDTPPSRMAVGARASREARVAANRARAVYRAVIQTLPYRDAEAVTDRTIQVVNDGVRAVDTAEVYRTLFRIAPQPRNRLNAEALHRHLAELSMPKRDATFGFATYGEIFDESTPAAMLGRWASRGPYPSYDPTVIELSAIPIIWLLSSPNRFMRDWLTKALVQLLRGHLDVGRRLLERFWTVNDAYVRQRLIVVLYGAVMRWRGSDTKQARALVARVHELVFTPPVPADELLLDAAHGIVEWGVANDLGAATLLDSSRRPYGLKPPSTPPSEETLKRRYARIEDGRYEDSYYWLYSSVMSMGDFGHYVVPDISHHFSKYRLQRRYPAQRRSPTPRRTRKGWQAFLDSLKPEQRAMFEGLDADSTSPFLLAASGVTRSLTRRQRALLAAAWTNPRRLPYRNDDYSAELAKRWVLHRTVALGWTPRLFGEEDRWRGHGRSGREAHKAERWGKKYQWMAFHELLARVADNYHVKRSYDDWRPYDGLHAMSGRRDLDPSVPPLDYRRFTESVDDDVPGWPPPRVALPAWPPARIDFGRYDGDIDRFVADVGTEPRIPDVVFSADDKGERWVLMEAIVDQGDPTADEYWRGLQQPMHLHSILVPSADAPEFLGAAISDLSELHNAMDRDGHSGCCYAGEIGWSNRECPHYHRDLRRIELGELSSKFVEVAEKHGWGAGYDCSTESGSRAYLPSSFIQGQVPLTRDDSGPCWLAGDEVVFTNYGDGAGDRSRGFLVRADWLARFLKEQKLDLVSVQWHQRWEIHDSPKPGDPWEEVTAVAWLDSDLVVHEGGAVRERR
jgi:hypothetical protein